MPFLTKPIQIGAVDLKGVVGFSHCGSLHMKTEAFFRRQWKQKYVVISKGCLYIYSDMYSKKPEKAYSLGACVSARAENGEEGGFCFHIFVDENKPLLFACETAEDRKKWLKKIQEEIDQVHPNLSADSGYGGSASSVPGSAFEKSSYQVGSYFYDVVNDREKEMKEDLQLQKCSVFQETNQADETRPKTLHEPESSSVHYINTTDSGFLSIQGGIQNSSLLQSSSFLSVRGDQDMDSDTNRSSDEIIYENTEALVKKITIEDYRKTKKRLKKIMNATPEGTFVVHPGDETKQILSVMTPEGLKHFRIHEKDEQVSLFKDLSNAQAVFSTVDYLISHYRRNPLPSNMYSVTLTNKITV